MLLGSLLNPIIADLFRSCESLSFPLDLFGCSASQLLTHIHVGRYKLEPKCNLANRMIQRIGVMHVLLVTLPNAFFFFKRLRVLADFRDRCEVEFDFTRCALRFSEGGR